MSRVGEWRENLGRSAWRLTGVRAFWTLLPFYVVLLFLLRWALTPVASADDAEQLIFAQSLSGGYNPAQPPLYTWLVWGMSQLVGAGLFAVLLVKFLLFYLIFVFTALAATTLIPGSDQARLAPLGLLGLGFVCYESIYNFSNTIAMAAAIMATIWLLARLHRRHEPGTPWGLYAALGLALGLGLLSKYGFGLFLGALLIAMPTLASFRRVLFSRGIWATLAVAGFVLLPHLVWLLVEGIDLLRAFGQRLGTDEAGDGAVAEGLLKLVNGTLLFLLPFLAFALLLFPRAALPLPPAADAEREFVRLGNRFFFAVVGLILIAVVILEIPNVRTHYMYVLIGFPLWWLLRVRGLDLPPRRFRQYATVLALCALMWPTILAVRWYVGPYVQKRPDFYFPYARLAHELHAAGYDGRGTIVAHFHRTQIGGNLKNQFPRAAVLSTKYPYYRPPRSLRGPCLVVWWTDAGDKPPQVLVRFARRLGLKANSKMVAGRVSAPIPRRGGERMTLAYFLMPEKTGGCD